jgi:hypothetical protein
MREASVALPHGSSIPSSTKAKSCNAFEQMINQHAGSSVFHYQPDVMKSGIVVKNYRKLDYLFNWLEE